MSSRGTDESKRAQTAALVALAVLAIALAGYSLKPVTPPSNSSAARPLPSATQAPTVEAVIIGDSYYAGNGGEDADGADTIAARVADGLGWDYADYTVGGTGFTAKGYTANDKTFGEYADEVIAAKPDVVLIEGGGNDTDKGTEALRAAATEALSKLRKGIPKTPIVMLGPLYSGTNEPDGVEAAGAIRAAAESVDDITYIDPAGWFPGEFYSTTGPGREYVGPDRVHPNKAGADLLVRKSIKALKKAGVPQGG